MMMNILVNSLSFSLFLFSEIFFDFLSLLQNFLIKTKLFVLPLLFFHCMSSTSSSLIIGFAYFGPL
jgi:hypothetical protein